MHMVQIITQSSSDETQTVQSPEDLIY